MPSFFYSGCQVAILTICYAQLELCNVYRPDKLESPSVDIAKEPNMS